MVAVDNPPIPKNPLQSDASPVGSVPKTTQLVIFATVALLLERAPAIPPQYFAFSEITVPAKTQFLTSILDF